MRKLVQALLITLGCFSAAGVYAQEEGDSSEVATTEEGTTSQNRLFQQQEEDETGKN